MKRPMFVPWSARLAEVARQRLPSDTEALRRRLGTGDQKREQVPPWNYFKP